AGPRKRGGKRGAHSRCVRCAPQRGTAQGADDWLRPRFRLLRLSCRGPRAAASRCGPTIGTRGNRAFRGAPDGGHSDNNSHGLARDRAYRLHQLRPRGRPADATARGGRDRVRGSGVTAIVITRAGPLCTVQDAGRFGMLRHGVSASGPMDRAAFERTAMWLGGVGRAGVEFTMAGLSFGVEGGPLGAAFDGGSFTLRLNGEASAVWPTRLVLKDGDVVEITPGPAGNYG